MVKEIVIGCAGIAIGYFAGRYVTKIHYEEIMEKERKDMREYYEGKHPEKPPMPEYSMTQNVEVHNMTEEYVKPNKVDYTKYYQTDPAESESPSEDAPSVDEDDLGEVITADYKKNSKKPTKIIKADEFGDQPGFNTMELVYYQENEVLTLKEGSEEDIIYFDEIEDLIGDALVKFGFADNDETCIFVRNYSRGCDFEIIKVFGAFEG